MKKMWKSLTIGLVIGLFIFTTQPTQAKVTFNDLDESNTHYNSIQQLVQEGVLSGYPGDNDDRVFKPNQELSRAHAAVMFSRYFGYDKNNQSLTVLSKYADVDASHTYAKEIAYVTENDIFTGSNDAFMPNEPLGRDQMATVIARAFELSKYERDESVNVYIDNVYASHKQGVQLLGQHGLTTELTDFRPNRNITRGQFASFLFRTSETTFTPIVIEEETEEETEDESTPNEEPTEEKPVEEEKEESNGGLNRPPLNGFGPSTDTEDEPDYTVDESEVAEIDSLTNLKAALADDEVTAIRLIKSLSVTGIDTLDKPIYIPNDALTVDFNGSHVTNLVIEASTVNAGSVTTIKDAVVDSITVNAGVQDVVFESVTDTDASEHTFNGGGSNSIVFNGLTDIKGHINVTADEEIQIRSESADAKVNGTISVNSTKKVNINVPVKHLTLSDTATEVEVNQPVEEMTLSNTKTKIKVSNRNNVPQKIKRRPSRNDSSENHHIKITVVTDGQETEVEVETEIVLDFSLLSIALTQAKQVFDQAVVGSADGEYVEAEKVAFGEKITAFDSKHNALKNQTVSVEVQEEIDQLTSQVEYAIDHFRQAKNYGGVQGYVDQINDYESRLKILPNDIQAQEQDVIDDIISELAGLYDQRHTLTRSELHYRLFRVLMQVEWLEAGAIPSPFANKTYTINIPNDYFKSGQDKTFHIENMVNVMNEKGHMLNTEFGDYDYEIIEEDDYVRLIISNLTVNADVFYVVFRGEYFITERFDASSEEERTIDLSEYINISDVTFPEPVEKTRILVVKEMSAEYEYYQSIRSENMYVKPGEYNVTFYGETLNKEAYIYQDMTYTVTRGIEPLDVSAIDYTSLPIRQETTQNVNVEELPLYSYGDENGKHLFGLGDMLDLNQVHLNLYNDSLSFDYTLEKEGAFVEILAYGVNASDYDKILLTDQGFRSNDTVFNPDISYDLNESLSYFIGMPRHMEYGYTSYGADRNLAVDFTIEVNGESYTHTEAFIDLSGVSIKDIIGDYPNGAEILVKAKMKHPVLELPEVSYAFTVEKPALDFGYANQVLAQLKAFRDTMTVGQDYGTFEQLHVDVIQSETALFEQEIETIKAEGYTPENAQRLREAAREREELLRKVYVLYNHYDINNLTSDLAALTDRLNALSDEIKSSHVEVITALEAEIKALETEGPLMGDVLLYITFERLDVKVSWLENGAPSTPFAGELVELKVPRSSFTLSLYTEWDLAYTVTDEDNAEIPYEIEVSEEFVHFLVKAPSVSTDVLRFNLTSFIEFIHASDAPIKEVDPTAYIYDAPAVNWPTGIKPLDIMAIYKEDSQRVSLSRSENVSSLKAGNYDFVYRGTDADGNLYIYSVANVAINDETEAITVSLDEMTSYDLSHTFTGTHFFLNLISPVGGYPTNINVITPGEVLPNTLWINQDDSQLSLELDGYSATLLYHLYDSAVVLEAKNYFLDVNDATHFTDILASKSPLGQLYDLVSLKNQSYVDMNATLTSDHFLDLTVTDVEGNAHVDTLSNLYETTLVQFADNNQLSTPATLKLEATIDPLEIAPFEYVIEQ